MPKKYVTKNSPLTLDEAIAMAKGWTQAPSKFAFRRPAAYRLLREHGLVRELLPAMRCSAKDLNGCSVDPKPKLPQKWFPT